MPGTAARETTDARLQYCANCGRDLTMTSPWYWEFAGRIHLFCSHRCHDRFTNDPARRLIASPFGKV